MRPRTRAELYLLSVTFIWGSTFVLSKFLLEDLSPFTYVALRFGIASILFFGMTFSTVRNMPSSAIVQGGILGVLLFLGFAAQTVGLLYTSASKSAFITGMMVVLTPVFQLVIERKPPRIGNVIGVALVAVGLFLLTSPQGSSFNIGDALTLICAFTFAIYIVYMDVFGKQQQPSHLTFMQFVTTGLLALISIPLLEVPRLDVTPRSLWILAYMILFPTIIALYVQAKFQKDTTPTRSAIIFSIEPVIAAGFAYLVLRERIGLLGVVGGVVILLGLMISELSDLIFPRNTGEEGES
jgi:drug/metabolite transporter (DMT)-like permease